MKRMINILAIVLLLQIALFFGLRMTKVDSGEFSGNERLLAFSSEQVDQLLIEGREQQRLLLKKTEGQWVLPDHADAVADTEKVATQLDSLTSIKRTWPVAKTSEAVKRFKVAADSFERRLVFKSGDQELATLLLGSSPGFKKVHSRLQGEEQVFDIPYSTYQASLKTADWIDKEVLQFKADQISTIKFPDFTLQQQDGELSLAGLAENEALDNERAKELLDMLTTLSVSDLHSKSVEADIDSDGLNISVELEDGTSREYRFFHKEESTLLKVSGVEPIYKISNSIGDEIQKATREAMVKSIENTE